MKSYFSILILIVSASGLWQCGQSQAGATRQATTHISVRVHPVEPRPFEEHIHITGVVKARSQINVVAEESGTVKTFFVKKGQKVEAGAPLLELDNPVLLAAERDAKAALKQAELEAESARIMYEQKALSHNDYQRARLARERAAAAYDIAHTRATHLKPVAPVPGVINNRYVDKGAWVGPGTPLFEVVDLSEMHVTAGVPERYYPYITPGSKAVVRFDAWPDKQVTATITYVARSINPKNRTFDVELTLPPSVKLPLSPQMVANMQIVKQRTENGTVIPLDAIIESEKGRFVFMEDQNIARKHAVTLNAISGDSALVAGINAGDRLIIAGQRQVSDGDSVHVIIDETE
ncbi:MAG: efflux RND transporter periplasmic adaptor subunit [Calditrichaeota bacterium]|nr:MAG: efflux RND transporter periplasmic adaptor subunit [Calditrichota bacterium]